MVANLPLRIVKSFCTLLLLTSPVISYGHGYIVDSRSHFCQTHQNSGCGAVQYEPQSVEGPDRFPETGPADGTIASAGLSRFANLNEQTPIRWKKSPISAGSNAFTWMFTANHVTRDWRYFITRPDWNPSLPLSRSSFDLTPFCEYPGNFQRPPSPLVHNCNVPGGRSGYHIILGVWDVGDTSSSFYQVVDVNFSGDNPPNDEWVDVGDIQPAFDLDVGDRVYTRIFDDNGEIVDAGLQTSITIESEADGDRLAWPYLLAERINQTQSDMSAGIKAADGSINPASGFNDIFVKTNSDIVRVEIGVEENPVPVPTLTLSGVADEYVIDGDQPVVVTATVGAEFGYGLLVEIFGDSNQPIVVESVDAMISQEFNLVIESPSAGTYSIVVKLTSNGEFVKQVSKSFEIVSQEPPVGQTYDYVYPDSKSSYSAGDLVLGTDGNVYQCKPWPYSGWCRGWGLYYAPGTGLAWSDAWIFIGPAGGGAPPTPAADYVYPDGRGGYQNGVLVSGTDGNVYRCLVGGWCNGSPYYYAPGTGLAWSSAWQRAD